MQSKKIEFESDFPSISENEILQFETKYNLQLPSGYKEVMLNNNGGKPVARRFDTQDGKQTSSLMLLYPISEIEDPSLSSMYESLNKVNKIPSNLLAIGHDPIENQICISISGDDQGTVYYWSNDMEEDDTPSYTHFSIVADSFEEFIKNLYVPS